MGLLCYLYMQTLSRNTFRARRSSTSHLFLLPVRCRFGAPVTGNIGLQVSGLLSVTWFLHLQACVLAVNEIAVQQEAGISGRL